MNAPLPPHELNPPDENGKEPPRGLLDQRQLTYVQRKREADQESMRRRLRGAGLINAMLEDLRVQWTGEGLKLAEYRLRARTVLLGKILPDMKAVEVSGGRTLDEILLAARASAAGPEPWTLPKQAPPPLTFNEAGEVEDDSGDGAP